MQYQVLDAATTTDSGELTYRLAIDPQGTVNPAELSVSVHLPDGFVAESLPDGWTSDGDTLSFQTPAFEASTAWEITLSPDN